MERLNRELAACQGELRTLQADLDRSTRIEFNVYCYKADSNFSVAEIIESISGTDLYEKGSGTEWHFTLCFNATPTLIAVEFDNGNRWNAYSPKEVNWEAFIALHSDPTNTCHIEFDSIASDCIATQFNNRPIMFRRP
jgi:hypothetical protein